MVHFCKGRLAQLLNFDMNIAYNINVNIIDTNSTCEQSVSEIGNEKMLHDFFFVLNLPTKNLSHLTETVSKT